VAVHDQEELKREGRLVRRHTRASLMSDTKWRKLFAKLDASGLTLEGVWKFVGRDEAVSGRVSGGLYLDRPWIDSSSFGPLAFRAIEWLWVPRRVALGRRMQEVDRAAAMISELGRYPVEVSERGLLVRGYLGKTPSGAEVELSEALPLEV
jgi:hypothetical protein